MLDGFIIGVVSTVLGGLIIYHIFGIGKEKKPLKLSKALKIQIDGSGPAFNPGSTGKDGLAQNFVINLGIKFSNLSTKIITIRNIGKRLVLPEGYSISIDSTNPHNSIDIPAEGHIIINYICGVQIAGAWNGGATESNPSWVDNRSKVIASLTATRIVFSLTGDCISNDDSVSINENFDITNDIVPKIKSR